MTRWRGKIRRRKDGFRRQGQSFWSAVALPPLLRCKSHLKIIRDVHPIGWESTYHSKESTICFPLKPTSRTPGIGAGREYQSMPHRILVNVIQSCQKRFLKCNPGIPVRKPDLPSQPSSRLMAFALRECNSCTNSLRLFGSLDSPTK